MIDKSNESKALKAFADLTVSCHMTRSVLQQFAEGTLQSPLESARIKVHLAECGQCRDTLEKVILCGHEGHMARHPEDMTVGKEEFDKKLPALLALLHRRREHVEALARMVVPENKHWMIPTLIDTATKKMDLEREEPTRAAAFSGRSYPKKQTFHDNLLRMVALVDELEAELTSQWSQVVTEEAILRGVLDRCLGRCPAATGQDREVQDKVRDYYIHILLASLP